MRDHEYREEPEPRKRSPAEERIVKLKTLALNGGYVFSKKKSWLYTLKDQKTGKLLLETPDKELVEYLMEKIPKVVNWTAASALSAIAKRRGLK